MFSEEEAHQFPPSRPWDHAIELKEGAPKAIDCKVYPTTLTEDEALKNFIQEQLEKGYISKSKSPYASPFFFIKKKDGKLRPVPDYQKLNEYTIKNKYPLPLIPDLIAQVKDAWIFTKFDIRWGYNNVRIKEGDQHKAAFKTKYGLFEPNVMYFRLTNSPAMFHVMIGLHYFTDTLDCPVFLFPPLPSSKPMYDTIWSCACVRYDLTWFSRTIRSGGILMYDINLRATHTTILSTRGVQIPIDLVSSTTDSIRQLVVLFKPVRIPTSDPKSEFLCQSSHIAQNLQAPLNHLVRLGYLPRPRHHVSPILP